MEIKRKFYDVLAGWKADKRGQCLLVNGARQVGKTFLIEKFGRENYESFIEINFALEPKFAAVFEGSLDVRSIRERLTALRGDVRIVPGRTLLFLDEIQDCPDARTAFKPLALDGTFDVIASGSLLGIKYKRNRRGRTPRSIPVGFEREVVMHSLSFAEYLEAKGFADESLALVRRCFERREPVPDAVNERFHALFREYAVVGGMPAVASAFLERGHYGEVQTLQEALTADYVADIRKYADKTDKPKIEACFRAIPRILAKENRKFKYAEVEDRGTARKYLAKRRMAAGREAGDARRVRERRAAGPRRLREGGVVQALSFGRRAAARVLRSARQAGDAGRNARRARQGGRLREPRRRRPRAKRPSGALLPER